MEYMSKEKFEEAEKIEKFKNKMLKYIVYKKRTEAEIRQKFSEEDENLVDALAAGPLAAKKNAALVLATNKVTTAQEDAIATTKVYNEFEDAKKVSDKIYQVGHGVSRSVVKFVEELFIKKSMQK